MRSVGAFDAKTHLNELLEQVSRGESIQITRRGVPVARLVPPEIAPRKNPREIARELRALRKGVTLRGIKIRRLIDEGRRY